MKDDHVENGLVWIDSDSQAQGLVHFRLFPRPINGTNGIYLDDLFVHPDLRGQGIARELISALQVQARILDASVIRWITHRDNAIARGLYDIVARETLWTTYDMDV